MASIYGVELKKVKTWEGLEGMGLQANVYINNKCVGQVTDDAYGGDFRYDFDTTELDNKANEYRVKIWNKLPENKDYVHLYKDGLGFTDQFIDEIYTLLIAEKSWKKAQKTQWKHLIQFRIGPNGVLKEIQCREDVSDSLLIKDLAKRSNCKESEIVIEHRFTDLKDFAI